MGDMISREAALDKALRHCWFCSVPLRGAPCGGCIVDTISGGIKNLPTVDAVPRDEYEALLRRFRHLLQSDFIHSFDEYDPKTGTYKRDIAEADKAEHVRHGRWITESIPQEGYNTYCSHCKRLLHNAPFIPYNFCPHCGAKMDGGKENA